MNGKLLVSRKTYSFAKNEAVTEWIVKPFKLDRVKMPHDFEERLVNANLKMKALNEEFRELDFDWNERNNIKTAALEECNRWNGLTDIAWYSEDMKLAVVIESHINRIPTVISALTIEELENRLDGHEC